MATSCCSGLAHAPDIAWMEEHVSCNMAHADLILVNSSLYEVEVDGRA